MSFSSDVVKVVAPISSLAILSPVTEMKKTKFFYVYIQEKKIKNCNWIFIYYTI